MITILLVLFLFASGNADQWPETLKGKVSINSKEYEKKFNIKIMEKGEIQWDKSETVNLDNMKLHIVKKNIIQSNAISQLHLENNLLRNIPDDISNSIPNLRYLDLSRNKINLYKINILKHPKLQIMDVCCQDVQELVSETELAEENFIKIEDIYELQKFNNTGMYLPSLEHLILNDNYISTLSSDFKKSFPHLIRLDLININARILDPQFFNNVPMSLRIIHLENNHISNITLQNIAQVSEFYLDGNPLERINIASTSLRILSLSNCSLFKYGTFNTPNLEYLDLSRNNYHSTSNIQFDMFQSLSTLLLDHNKLSEILIRPRLSLTELSLSYNIISDIEPDNFKYLINLRKLSLKGNKIMHVDKDVFVYLKNLEYLDLSENELKSLPQDWMIQLINLRYLNLSSNQFTAVSNFAINLDSSLMHLFIKDNHFTEITAIELISLPNYITVYLA